MVETIVFYSYTIRQRKLTFTHDIDTDVFTNLLCSQVFFSAEALVCLYCGFVEFLMM